MPGEHLGISLSVAGDVNRDGLSDFAVGALCGAYCFYFGPGIARVYSGKDGTMIYQVFGSETPETFNGMWMGHDGFANDMAYAGDTNGDGYPDLLAVAWRWNNDAGYVNLYSGKDASVIRQYRGDEGWGGAIHAPVGTVGDVNGDGCSDVFVSRDAENVVVCSGKTGDLLFDSRDKTPSRKTIIENTHRLFVGDVDGDGTSDWMQVTPGQFGFSTNRVGRIICGEPVRKRTIEIHSGVDGRVLRTFPAELPLPWSVDQAGAAGDIDGDGIQDIWVCFEDYDSLTGAVTDSRPESRPGESPRIVGNPDSRPLGLAGPPRRCLQILSGRDGHEIGRVMSASWSFADHGAVGLGDLDGDGRGELLVGDYEMFVNGPCGGAAYVLSFPPSGR
jgi:hypothetical protein